MKYSFEKEKIIYGEIVPEPRFVYDNENYYIEATGFLLSSKNINLKYLVSLLNSKLLFWYFKDIGYNLGGKGYRYKKIFLEQIPIKFSDKTTEQDICILVDQLLEQNKFYVNEIQSFYSFLISEIHVNKISKKLENYYNLNIKELKSEIKKQKGDNNQEEIKFKFEESSNKIISLNQNINKIETKLNKIIYEIYNISENEIKIIEEDIEKI